MARLLIRRDPSGPPDCVRDRIDRDRSDGCNVAIISRRGGFTTSLRADFTGVGVANLASAGVGAYSVDASPGATVVMQSSGTKSQLGSVIGAVCVLVVVLFAGGLLADLPTATLAAIMILLSVRIVNVKELRRIRSYSKPALALTIVTFAAVVILGVELGVLIALRWPWLIAASRPRGRRLLNSDADLTGTGCRSRRAQLNRLARSWSSGSTARCGLQMPVGSTTRSNCTSTKHRTSPA